VEGTIGNRFQAGNIDIGAHPKASSPITASYVTLMYIEQRTKFNTHCHLDENKTFPLVERLP